MSGFTAVTVQGSVRSLLRDAGRSALKPLLRRLADLDTRLQALERRIGALVATQGATEAGLANFVEVTSELQGTAVSLAAKLAGVQARYDELLEVISQQNALARETVRRCKEVERQVSFRETLEP